MKIAILGSRGVPNRYGGFEQFAEYLALGLVKKTHEVSVYNSHTHPFQESNWNDIHIIHCFDPETRLGTVGQFIYDFNCIMDARKREFDIILFLGYTSSSIWGRIYPKNSCCITNMDGLEWKRSKYSRPVQKFLKFAERWAINSSDALVADSIGIQTYLNNHYDINSTYIPYGANKFVNPNPNILETFSLKPFTYNMLMARMEPENNIEIILEGIERSKSLLPILIVGNTNNKYGNYIKTKFSNRSKYLFVGGIFDLVIINNLRYFSNIYFHGHSVGGTNPSLLEAMSSGALIAAHGNIFNRAILGDDAFYFTSVNDVEKLVNDVNDKNEFRHFVINNYKKIEEKYNWECIIDQYESLFLQTLKL
jgi:Glycosyltransferase